MKRVLSWFLLIFFSFLGKHLPAQANSTDSLLETAEMKYIDNDYIASFSLFEKCYNLDILDLKCLYGMARAAQKMGAFKKAKTALHLLEKNEGYKKIAFRHLSAIYEIEENLPKSIKYYTL